jgi:hypothetical protein
MSKWDWLHAGLEVANLVGIKEMRSGVESEATRRLLIEAMKNYIYAISRDIELAEEQISKDPQQIYILSKITGLRLENSGISATDLPDFQDKEYFSKTKKKIAEVIKKSQAKLTQQQIQDSDTAVQYLPSMPLLQPAIAAKAAEESLSKTRNKWEEMSSRNGHKQLFMIGGVLGLIISCLILFIIMSTNLQGESAFITFTVIAVLIGSIIAIIKGSSTDPKYTELRLKREELQEQLMPNDKWEQVVAIFGNLSSKQFKKIYDERISFLSSVFGEDFEKYLNSGE